MKVHPDFEEECRLCGASPTVVVENHPKPDTLLCGIHFFHDQDMAHWEDWNNEETQDD